MTHTLHRLGTIDSLQNDYVIIVMAAKGINSVGSIDPLRKAVMILNKHNPSNIGLITCGNKYTVTIDEIIEKMDDGRSFECVFDNKDDCSDALKELKETNLGLSVVCTGLYENILGICKILGIKPHTVHHSLGIFGKVEKLPKLNILEFTTMCGHHQISSLLVEKLLADVMAKRITPQKAAVILGKICVCGVFNVSKAKKLFEKHL
jgi:hypothetical protein